MALNYADVVSSGVGKSVASRLGLPQPTKLRRYAAGELCPGPVLVTGGGAYAAQLVELVSDARVEVLTDLDDLAEGNRLGGIVLDMTALRHPSQLEHLRAVGAPAIKRLGANGRVVVIGVDPASRTAPAEVATARSLEGIVRSIAKELRQGSTANLVLAQPDSASAVRSATEFFLSGRSAFVDGQPIVVGQGEGHNASGDRPLKDKVAVVTGAARGIGAAIAKTLARDGATVVCVDVPAAGEPLSKVANGVRGTALQIDVTADDAGRRIVEHCHKRYGRLDIVVHNAGITRDKLFVNTDDARWGSVISVNLLSILKMNEAFLGDGGIVDGGRIVCVSSMSGIAGNRGQANYAASKAGVIGLVDSLSTQVKERGITVNAVAPGFIETEMTGKIPFATREVGRMFNSLKQGGLPIDVAEVIAWFSQPAAQGITGQTLRVCGQNLLGA